MRPPLLTQRALGRATLARQLLLRRSEMDVIAAVEHLVGLQAQVPLDPYTGLWSRLERFRPETLSEHLAERRVVRIVVMRGDDPSRDCRRRARPAAGDAAGAGRGARPAP